MTCTASPTVDYYYDGRGLGLSTIPHRAGEYYQYDAAGNLIKDRVGNAYSFDGDSMQASFTYAGAAQAVGQFFYDGDGQRVKKVFGGETTVFVYDAFGKPVAEYYGAQPSSHGTTYMTTDPLGTPRVNTDAVGVVVARHDYEPFGAELGAYGGRASHAEYGLDYAQARL